MQFNIVTPSYNQDKFLVKTILSVLSQKGGFKLNYQVMDGGSTDASKEILKIFKKKLKYESKKDKGQSDAINKGIAKFKKISKSKKAIFAFINSDDYYLPGAFKKVIEVFKKNPNKMWLIGDCKIIDENNKEIQTLIKIYKKLLRFLPLTWTLSILNPIAQPAVFIRQEAVEKIGLLDNKLNFTMDYKYWLELLREFNEPIKLRDELSAFRIHNKSKGGANYEEQFNEELQVAKNYVKHPLLLTLHKWHNNIIISIYKFIK
ncbi:MAG: glycosyltransferase [Patescibacteria group bacterium]